MIFLVRRRNKMKKFILGVLSLFSLSYASNIEDIQRFASNLNEVKSAINKVKAEEAFINVCEYEPNECKNIVSKLYKKFKNSNKYKLYLYYIALTETELKHRQGLTDKDDISFFQINFKNKFVRYLAKKYKKTKEQLKYDTFTSSKIALSVLIMNTYYFMKTNKTKNFDDKIILSTYHRPFYIDKDYYKKVSYIQDKYRIIFLSEKDF